jgi:hypothetical protein
MGLVEFVQPGPYALVRLDEASVDRQYCAGGAAPRGSLILRLVRLRIELVTILAAAGYISCHPNPQTQLSY